MAHIVYVQIRNTYCFAHRLPRLNCFETKGSWVQIVRDARYPRLAGQSLLNFSKDFEILEVGAADVTLA
jgi:hypothetical protein